MADYRELLRRAISALPENNGAARRAVYEKARTALVGQLRAINPPLPARDITQHRLQLEDCIRQVEQEASEAVISLGREGQAAARPAFTPRPASQAPKPVVEPVLEPAQEPEPQPILEPQPAPEPVAAEPAPEPEPVVEATPEPEPPAAEEPPTTSIEDIIAQASSVNAPSESEQPAVIPLVETKPESKPGRLSFFSRRETPPPAVANTAAITFPPASTPSRIESSLGSTALARQPASEPVIISPPLPTEPALSSVREVDLENDEAKEAEGAIERAIETLDREARGEFAEPLPERNDPAPLEAEAVPERPEDAAFAAANAETRSGAGLTIFLVVFALLLVGVGGAGFWAWREGFVDLDQMFGSSTPTVTEQAQVTEPVVPTMDTTVADTTVGDEGAAGPGNTATTQANEPTAALEGLETDDRLEPSPEPVVPTGTETVLPALNGEAKSEERLSGADTTIAATDDPVASVDPVNLAGNQSLLLEASADGQSGAVPFSGTVDWTEGTDEIGAPTLVGEASIPARNLGVSITIRKNNDPVLPASHLMEISFDVPDTFIGGSIATLAGVLLKDEELVPGTALEGAAARVVGNSFLFALSASEEDVATNTGLLDSQRWLDLAVVYGTGRNAILTLEKDEDAQVLFDRVLTAWRS
ncbi:hypothetical protein [Devosia rhizoryzae]|uniref:Uncharacterized protein n=1 Tax=Devosia rhizoryzae TaxID=2774137 RepID=A0ABX7C784_9HYPH|nr:hypothetical protein [Devosia rhizoryzae]QQR39602.1 hypothetical protein JI748_00870 [Devosia rhizoryzae]